MKTVTYRGCKKQIQAELGMRMLDALRDIEAGQPLVWIDLVRRVRDRKHTVSDVSAEFLLRSGLASDQKPTLRLHDVWIELVKESVQGDGLAMTIVWPFMEEPEIPAPAMGVLADSARTRVNTVLVDAILAKIHALHDEDPVAIPELYRMLTRKGGTTFDPALRSLIRKGLVTTQETDVLAVDAAGNQVFTSLSATWLFIPDVLQQLVPIVLRGHTYGLPIFHSPYGEQVSKGPDRNGQAHANGKDGAKHRDDRRNRGSGSRPRGERVVGG